MSPAFFLHISYLCLSFLFHLHDRPTVASTAGLKAIKIGKDHLGTEGSIVSGTRNSVSSSAIDDYLLWQALIQHIEKFDDVSGNKSDTPSFYFSDL